MNETSLETDSTATAETLATVKKELVTVKKELAATTERSLGWQKRALEAENSLRAAKEEIAASGPLNLFLSGVTLSALAWFGGVGVARIWPYTWGQHVMGAVALLIFFSFSARALGRMGWRVTREHLR